MGNLANFFILPPLFPEKQNVISFFLLAIFIASIKFWLLPEVVIPTHISPDCPNASICLENIYLKLKSLPIAVRADVSVVNASPGRALLFLLKRTVNSVARCWASEALPPLPKNIIFFLLFIAFIDLKQSSLKFIFSEWIFFQNWVQCDQMARLFV